MPKYTLTKRGHIVPVKPLPIKENRVQKNCIRWFDIQYPKLTRLLFHIPNGGSRNKITNSQGKKFSLEAIEFKRMGVRRGTADLFLSIPNEKYFGFYIEMKREGEQQSYDQREFEKEVTSLGYRYEVLDDIDKFCIAVQNYLSTTPFHKPTWRQPKLADRR